MMKTKAVCIKCGSRKSTFRAVCPKCHFKPKSHEELVVSFRASTAYYDSEERRDGVSVEALLIDVEKVIKSGANFSDSEIAKIDRKVKLMRRESNKVLLIGLAGLLIGILMIFAAIMMVRYVFP